VATVGRIRLELLINTVYNWQVTGGDGEVVVGCCGCAMVLSQQAQTGVDILVPSVSLGVI
jgi:hypothetical protein